jgi:hypothetical protein
MTAGAVAVYLPYAVFPEWPYLRFLLPAMPFVFVLIAALLVHVVALLPAPVQGLSLLVIVTIAASVNVNVARREQAFNLRRYEARYYIAGRYLDTALPPGAVVFAVQQSGSVRHYARTPIVRWDHLRIELETAVADLRARGRHPVFLVEDWETSDIRSRFPASALARLDWTPRAEFGETTRVRLYDPADRGLPSASIPDRLR